MQPDNHDRPTVSQKRAVVRFTVACHILFPTRTNESPPVCPSVVPTAKQRRTTHGIGNVFVHYVRHLNSTQFHAESSWSLDNQPHVLLQNMVLLWCEGLARRQVLIPFRDSTPHSAGSKWPLYRYVWGKSTGVDVAHRDKNRAVLCS